MAKRQDKEDRIVVIEWIDHFSDSAWTHRNDVAEACKRELTNITIGFVVYEDAKRIALAQTIGTDDDRCCDVMTVYKNHIIKRVNVG